jgi:peptidoglycan/LPS O-acetylase OafA/YrhL
MSTRQPLLRRPAVAFLVDVVLVVVFAAIGRASHSETSPVLGAVTTAWPFLVGTLVGWTVVRLRRKGWPIGVGPGITVWFSTVLFGMLLRLATQQGTALPFVAVAAVTLAVLLIGWRALAGRSTGAGPRADRG